jgi:uncharacterized hydrophobic protein (TIGR00271 family)
MIVDSATKQLGVKSRDRAAIYREAAEAGTNNRTTYWAVLLLSGAIATLGLALNSSAVVIGAMLVAPLLAPVLGLALALAVGDGRLAIQTAVVVVGSTIGVILIAAALTAVLPFHTVTVEISVRTRPTTLDLAIAVFSGLVGAVVTVDRRSRLSAAIPGVAIAVALIPPLAVAGFGLGTGRGDLVRGSLLLYAANLAGIVLSGMSVFLLIGMHRAEVLSAARRWHDEAEFHGLAAWAYRLAWVRSLGVFQSPWARIGLVLAFVVALGLPLSRTLAQIARETRIERAVADAERALFDIPGRASILGRQIVFGGDQIHVYVRVATTEWFGPPVREEFERRASMQVGEPVRISLEQLPARGEDIDQLRNLFPGPESRAAAAAALPPALEELLVSARARLAQAVEDLVLPGGVTFLRTEIATTDVGDVGVRADYAAAEPLAEQAEEMLRLQLQRGLRMSEFDLAFRHVPLETRTIGLGPEDPVLLDVIELLRSYPALHVDILAPEADETTGARTTIERLHSAGIAPERVTAAPGNGPGVQARVGVRVATQE